MKKIILSLVALVITGVCFAQDVIVRKDGSTIQAKIIKVGKSEVEYKKYDNHDGPTYTIKVGELQCINYENGTNDTFVTHNYNPNIVTNETATQYSSDKELLDMYYSNKKIVTPEMLYKRGKRMKIAGYAVGGTLLALGVVSIIIGAAQPKYYSESWNAYDNDITHLKYYNGDRNTCFYIGYGVMAGGVAIGVPLVLTGSALQKKYGGQIHSVSAISYDLNFSNGSSLNLGIDLLSDNFSFIKTPGIGVRYNF